MKFLSKLFGGTAKGLIEGIAGAADRFITTGDEKRAFKGEVAKMVLARDTEIEETTRQEMQSKERVLVAELAQGDSYTKRARPTVVYAGLLLLAVNHVVLPWIAHFTGEVIPEILIPTAFWTAWGGICMTWVIGRTAERRGVQNKLTEMITGK